MKLFIAACVFIAVLSPVVHGVFRKTICEGHKEVIKCPYGLRIAIKSANYGRTDKHTCAKKGTNVFTTKCESKITKDCVKDYCEGKTSCRLEAINSVYTDQCYGTYKYLSVTYGCDQKQSGVYESVVCEGKYGHLYCKGGKVIDIKDAYYGRTDIETCPSKSAHSTSCKAPHAYYKVETYCQGKESCKVAANNQLFGDPCHGTYKYLRIHYSCVNRGYY